MAEPTWQDRESALQRWVRTASALPDASVYWADQNGYQATGDFITLRQQTFATLGACDDVVESYDAAAPAGEEMVVTVQGRRQLTVRVQAYVGSASTGPNTAKAILSRVRTALSLPSVRSDLEANGLTNFDASPVQNITAIVGTDFESRAYFDAEFYTDEFATERTGYIATADVTIELEPVEPVSVTLTVQGG